MGFEFVEKVMCIGGESSTPPVFQFYKRGFVLGGNYEPTWQDIILSGRTALTLVNAKANGLNYLKLFGACEQRKLPKGFTQLKYIESTGTQYIDTGYVPKANTIIDVDFKSTKVSGEGFTTLYGTQKDANEGRLYVLFGTTNVVQVNIPRNSSALAYLDSDGTAYTRLNDVSNPFFTNNRTHYILDIYNKTFKALNTTWDLSILTGTFVSPTYNLYLLTRNSSGTADSDCSKGYLYGAKIFEGSSLVKNLVPAKRNSDNVLGLYDTVSGNFLINAGTGTFISGGEATPTPDLPIDIYCNNGKLKTRNSSGLPLEYQQIEFIESNGTQFIDTLINADSDLGYRCKVAFTTLDTNKYMGAIKQSGAAYYRNNFGLNNRPMWSAYYGTTGTTAINFMQNADTNPHIVEQIVDPVNQTVTNIFDGTTYNDFTYENYDIGVNFYLFRRNGNSDSLKSFCSMQIWWFQLIRNGVLLRDFVPVKRRTDNVLGMYDKVSGIFFINQGTGTFIAGNVVDGIEIYTDGTTETVKDSLNNTATAQNLLSVGSYKDEQNITTGVVTRRCEAVYYDGTQTINTPYISTTGGLNVGSIIIHPLSTPTTEAVTPQVLTTKSGTNIIEITQSSIDNLELEVSYKAGVAVTVTEVENANLSNNVTVTIGE